MKRPGLGAVCALLLATPSVWADAPPPPPVQQPAEPTATCEVFEVWATHGKGSADPAINKALAKRLETSLKQNDFKQLSTQQAALTAKKAQPIKLSKGSATITLVETVNKSQLRLNVEFSAAKGNSKQNVLVAAGDYVIVSVNQSGDAKAEAHVLAVGSCK